MRMLLNHTPALAQIGQPRLPPTQAEIDDVFHIDWALGTGNLDSSAYLEFLLVRSSACPECALAEDVVGCMRQLRMRQLRLNRLRCRPRVRARRSRHRHGGSRERSPPSDDGGGGGSDGPPPPPPSRSRASFVAGRPR
jgi:hypothetical protein